MQLSKVLVLSRKSALALRWVCLLVACGRCTTGMSKGKPELFMTCWRRVRSVLLLLKNSYPCHSFAVFATVTLTLIELLATGNLSSATKCSVICTLRSLLP